MNCTHRSPPPLSQSPPPPSWPAGSCPDRGTPGLFGPVCESRFCRRSPPAPEPPWGPPYCPASSPLRRCPPSHPCPPSDRSGPCVSWAWRDVWRLRARGPPRCRWTDSWPPGCAPVSSASTSSSSSSPALRRGGAGGLSDAPHRGLVQGN